MIFAAFALLFLANLSIAAPASNFTTSYTKLFSCLDLCNLPALPALRVVDFKAGTITFFQARCSDGASGDLVVCQEKDACCIDSYGNKSCITNDGSRYSLAPPCYVDAYGQQFCPPYQTNLATPACPQ
jgi:hypothetical protein